MIQAIASGFISFIFMMIIVPILKKIAVKFNLTDRPNNRKLHQEPVPLIGGIAIAITITMLGLTNYVNYPISKEQLVILLSSITLLCVGIIDDKYDLRAKYKLLIQLFCAFVIAASGSRITSLYGVFGVYEIPVLIQYTLTVIVICGVVNAFNLMDGIDGLAGELSIIGFLLLAIFSFLINDTSLAILCFTFLGAIAGFLKFNLKAHKIFMGDAGSLFIGNLLIGFSIHLLQNNTQIISAKPVLLYAIIGFFALPVLDSLRVYLGRLKKGISPFEADKTHLHHLFLSMNLSHKKTSIIISMITLSILSFSLLISYYMTITVSIILVVLVFSLLGFVLNQIKKVYDWQQRIREIEDLS
ncbi:MAG: MraY family glycosyltransferase [Bacteroidia bacterium]|nr:MraY family glycosyltransferase [Bacteroidia bacterium]